MILRTHVLRFHHCNDKPTIQQLRSHCRRELDVLDVGGHKIQFAISTFPSTDQRRIQFVIKQLWR